MMRMLPLFFLALTAAVQGAEVGFPSPGDAPAAFRQSVPTVASNGRGFVAVWADERSQRISGVIDTAIFASPLDDRGRPLEPLGIRIAEFGQSPRIASTGDGYVVVYRGTDRLRWLRLDDNARPLSPSNDLGIDFANQQIGSFASNGSTYLLTTFEQNGTRTRATTLDRDGRALETIQLTPPSSRDMRALVVGGTYHVIRDTLLGPLVDDAVGVAQHPLMYGIVRDYHLGAAAAGDDRILVAWLASGGESFTKATAWLDFALFDGAGTMITTPRRLFEVPVGFAGQSGGPSVGWDGREFLIAWPSPQPGASGGFASRIAADGTPIDAAPVRILDGYPGLPQFATSASGTAIVWPQDGDVVARMVQSFDEVIAHPAEREVVAQAKPRQSQPAIAAIGSNVATAWSEDGAIVASMLPAKPFVIAPADARFAQSHPAVAAIGDVALIVWRRADVTTGGSQILARRFDAGGAALDAQPLVLDAMDYSPLDDHLSVSGEGGTFFACWPAAYAIHAARITAGGMLLDPAPIVVSRPDEGRAALRTDPHAVWTGGGWAVVWLYDLPPSVIPSTSEILSSSPPHDIAVQTARVTKDGAVAGEVNLAPKSGDLYGLDVTAAWHDGVLEIVFTRIEDGTECIYTMHEDGVLQPLYCAMTQIGGLEAVWRNGALFVAWHERVDSSYTLRSLRVGVDSEPQPFSPAGDDVTNPALAVGPLGMSVAYERVDPASGYVSRVFVRPALAPRRRPL